jgi:hypothetical protein
MRKLCGTLRTSEFVSEWNWLGDGLVVLYYGTGGWMILKETYDDWSGGGWCDRVIWPLRMYDAEFMWDTEGFGVCV